MGLKTIRGIGVFALFAMLKLLAGGVKAIPAAKTLNSRSLAANPEPKIREFLAYCRVEKGLAAHTLAAYRRDLAKWPNNGWSLYGLSQCLRARGADDEAQRIEMQFLKTWSNSGLRIGSSCLCVPKI